MTDDVSDGVREFKQLRDLKVSGKKIGEMLDELCDGGPEVDEEAILLYLADSLDEESMRIVGTQIDTWADWNRAYWRASAELSAAEHIDDLAIRDKPPTLGREGKAGGAQGKLHARTAVLACATALLMALGWYLWPVPDPVLVASIADPFGMVTVDSAGNVSGLDGFPQSFRQEVRTLLESRSVTIPEEALGSRGPEDNTVDLAYVYPVSQAVRTQTPTLTWQSQGDSATYSIAITTVGEAFPESDNMSATEWTVVPALPRGRVYSWRLLVLEGEEQFTPEGNLPRFEVLSADDLGALEVAERESNGSHLILTVLYCRYGLYRDAREQLQLLREKYPDIALLSEINRSLPPSRK